MGAREVGVDKRVLLVSSFVIALFFISTSVAHAKKGPDHLSVVGASADINATNIPVNEPISVTFNLELDPETLNSDSLFLKQNGTPVAGTIRYDITSKTAFYFPNEALQADKEYEIHLTQSLKSTHGLGFPDGYEHMSWSFRTEKINFALSNSTGFSRDNIGPRISASNFALELPTQPLEVFKGEARKFSIGVNSSFGYPEIKISLVGSPNGFSMDPLTIPEGSSRAVTILHVPLTAELGTYSLPIQATSSGKIIDSTLSVTVVEDRLVTATVNPPEEAPLLAGASKEEANSNSNLQNPSEPTERISGPVNGGAAKGAAGCSLASPDAHSNESWLSFLAAFSFVGIRSWKISVKKEIHA